MVVYLDTSAAAKLMHIEPETEALTSWLTPHTESMVSSDLLRTELLRTSWRYGPGGPEAARQVLDTLHLEPLTTALTEAAGVVLGGHPVRSLDALHIATAQTYGDQLHRFVTYDHRQADAARALGIPVESPA